MKLCQSCATTFDTTTWRCPHCGNEPSILAGFPSFAPGLSSDEGFEDTYFHNLVEFEARNFWFRSRNKLILWALKRYFTSAKNFLEIGCGTGFVLSGVATAGSELKLSGSEISSAGLAYAAKRVPSANFFQMDARAIPFVDEFDVIGAFDVLEHIEDDETVLRQMHQATRPGGGIVLTVPQHAFLWSRADDHAHHVRRYAARDLINKVVSAGFRVERVTSFVSLLLPLMMASRARQPISKEQFDPLTELKIGRFSNAILEKIMNIEYLAIKAGLNLPAGGSLLLIARR